MPVYHFHEVHATEVHARPDRIFRVIKETRPADIPLFNALFWMRSLPGHMTGRGRGYFTDERTILEQALDLGFVVLAEAPDQELVFGAIAQWWRVWGATFHPVTAVEDFLTFDRPDYAMVAANFYVNTDDQAGRMQLHTETRIYATDPTARKKFGIYWRIIYPGSALIRRMWLKSIKQRAEQGASR